MDKNLSATSSPPAFDPSDGHEHARRLLAGHNLRATTPRLAILYVLESLPAPGHVSATELRRRLTEIGVDADLTTAYRTLATLTSAGIVHALPIAEKATVYGLAEEPHHHAVCRNCGDVIEIPATELAVSISAGQPGGSFTLDRSDGLVLSGLCPNCQVAARP